MIKDLFEFRNHNDIIASKIIKHFKKSGLTAKRVGDYEILVTDGNKSCIINTEGYEYDSSVKFKEKKEGSKWKKIIISIGLTIVVIKAISLLIFKKPVPEDPELRKQYYISGYKRGWF